MSANKFILKGAGIEVDYTIGGNPSFPALLYKSGAFEVSFEPNEITSEDTGLGRLVSVSLFRSIDTGGERFGFFLPFINLTLGHTSHFHSIGVYEMFSGPNSIPHRPSTWRCVELSGTAQTIIVPL
jgi:hypothetical protein